MKLITKIARNELLYLFYSPIAWFILIVFWVQVAVIYTGIIVPQANAQELLIKNSPLYRGSPDSLTLMVFIQSGFFGTVVQNLFLFIPLLTMGLISHEVNSGSFRLLYSSPVKLRQIVLGKYLGIVLYNLLFVAIVASFVITGAFNIQQVELGTLLSALLGFYLVVCAYAAIGLFMSSLSGYQIVSALSTFTILFILSRIGGLWQKYDVIRDFTWFLSLQNRVLKMLLGLITSKDVIYFLIVSLLFVSFTVIKLKAGREAKPWYVSAARYLTALAIALAMGYISSRPALTGYLDTSAGKRNTIHPRTQQLIESLGDSTLEVTLYTNLFGAGLVRGLPENRNADYFAVFWEPYLRFKPDIVFKYEYYYDSDLEGTDSALIRQYGGKPLQEIAKEVAEALDLDPDGFKKPADIRRLIDLKPEALRLIMKVSYKGRTEFLRTYDDPMFWPDEVNISAVLKRLTEPKIPKAYFISGNLERSIYKTGEREYAYHTGLKASRIAMINTGFNLDTINLSGSDIPADADMIILADPKVMLSDTVADKLKKYIDQGGNMFVTAEPGKQYVLNPLLNHIGVQLMNGQLVAPSFDETPEKVYAYLPDSSGNMSEQVRDLLSLLKATDDSATIYMPGATALSYKDSGNFKVKPFALTYPGKAWLKAGKLVIDSTLPDFDATVGDLRETSFPTILQLTREINNKEQRILVSGDADMLSNLRIRNNPFFVLEPYKWMNYGKNPAYLPRPRPKDIYYNISAGGAEVQRIVYVWILPLIVIAVGTILLIRRKRK